MPALATPDTLRNGPLLTSLNAVLSNVSLWSMETARELAYHPTIFQGWSNNDPSSVLHAVKPRKRTQYCLIAAAGRLDVRTVARLLNEPSTQVDVNAVLTMPNRKTWHTALSAVLAIMPMYRTNYVSGHQAWTPEQRASQEVIVGLLLAAGAILTPDAWSLSASNLFLGLMNEEDTNPRLLERLLATGQVLPQRLATKIDPSAYIEAHRSADASQAIDLSHQNKTRSYQNAEVGQECPTLLHGMAERMDDWPTWVLQDVLARGVPINAQNRYGQTALHVAASSFRANDNRSFVQTLLAAGARWDIPNCENVWPHHMSAGQPQSLTLKCLLDAGAPIEMPVMPTKEPHHGLVPAMRAKTLSKSRPDSHILNKKVGRTALHFAAASPISGDPLTLLLERGACVNVRDKNGNTPLHLATEPQALSHVQRLLAAGADPWLKNRGSPE